MKKIIYILIACIWGLQNTNAQEVKFGALGGLSILNSKVELNILGAGDETDTGFHIGAFAEFGLSDKFKVQPELFYEMAGDLSVINLSAIAKYYVAEGFNLQLGPQIGFIGGDDADAAESLFGEDYTSTNLKLAIGAGYDFTENIFAQARYGFQVNNHYTGDIDDVTFTINSITLSIGYKF